MSDGAHIAPGVVARLLGKDRRTIVAWIRKGILRGGFTKHGTSTKGRPVIRYYVFRASFEAFQKGETK